MLIVNLFFLEGISEIHNYLNENKIDRFFGQMKKPNMKDIFGDYILEKTMPYRDPSSEWESRDFSGNKALFK